MADSINIFVDFKEFEKTVNFQKKINSKRLLVDLGRKFITLNRQRIRNQKNIGGSSFPKTKTGKPALKKILKGKKSHFFQVSGENIKIGSRVHFAIEHQKGLKKTISAASHNELKKRKRVNVKGHCTNTQARYIKENWQAIWKADPFQTGSSKRKNKRKSVTLKWIKQNYTLGFAGFLIQNHKKKTGKLKKSWQVKLPERHVLGIDKKGVKDIEKVLLTSLNRMIA